MEIISFMWHLPRQNGTLGVLSAFVVVVLLHGNLLGYRLPVPGSGGGTYSATTSPFSQQQGDGQGHHLAIPFNATAPAAYSEQLLLTVLDYTPTSKSHSSEEAHPARNRTWALLATTQPEGKPVCRTHLFCVYRL